MLKKDLIVKVARDVRLPQREVAEIIQLFLDGITKELGAGRGLEFRNFGVFEVQVRKPRIGRNPKKASVEITIPERVVVKFKPGKLLRSKLAKVKIKTIKK